MYFHGTLLRLTRLLRCGIRIAVLLRLNALRMMVSSARLTPDRIAQRGGQRRVGTSIQSPRGSALHDEPKQRERHRRSRGGQGQLSCYVRLDRVEPKREAPQARSQDRLQAGGISCASIDGDDEEVSETQTRRLCGSTGSRAAKFGYRYAAADSLWQQGGRSEAWRPLRLGRMVRPFGH